MKKLFSVIAILFCATLCFAQNVSLNAEEEIDSELLEFVDELNSQDYLAEAEIISKLVVEISEINPKSQVIDFSAYTERLIPTNTEEFLSLPLSEKMKVFRENSKIENEMIEAFVSVAPSTKNSPEYVKQAELVQELLRHSTKLTTITTSIIAGSNDYVGAAIDNLKDAQELLEDAQIKANLLTTQISLLNETLAWQEQKNKNAYIAGNILIPVVGFAGLIPSVYLMAKGDERGFDYMMIDLGVTLGCELIWNGGHLIFKWW